MKFSLLFSLLNLALCAMVMGQYIPMQSHSFNDLDYIGQQLVKGIDSFKIDISSLDEQTCNKWSTWKAKDNECEINEYNVKICCLGLRGDTSSSPRLNDYFNTTTDFVSFLNNPKYDFILHKEKRLPRYNRTIYIAMNVQYNYVQGALTKNWLSSLVQAIKTRNLDIQLIFGGPYTINYFGDSCKNKTSACDDKAKTILSYPWILQSSDFDAPSNPYANFSNFNIEFPSLPKYCDKFFPSYGDALPYFFYEISHETDVQYIVNTYLSPTCKRNPSHPDLSKIRITSNIDHEMVQSYLPQASHFDGIKNGTNFLIETLEADQTALLAYYDTINKVTRVQKRSLQSSEKLPLIAETQLPSGKYTKMSYKAPYLLLANQTQAEIYTLTSGSFGLISVYKVPISGLDSDFIVYNNDVYFVEVSVEGQCPSDTISFSIIDLNTGKTVASQCSGKVTAFNVHEIQSGSLSVALDSSNTLRGLLFISATYRTLTQTKDAIYGFSFKSPLSDFSPIRAIVVQTPKSFIDMGVDPNIKLMKVNGSLFVLEAHSNGVCQCGNVINNGNLYKCGVPSSTNYHHAYLQNVKHLMNYNWGVLEHFESRILTGKYVSACDAQIMHGKFYNGQRPSGTVFRNPQGTLQALLVNQFVDYDDLPFITRLFGGATMPFSSGTPESSVVVNTFDILDYYLFSYL